MPDALEPKLLERKRAAAQRHRAMSDEFAHPCCQGCGFAYPPVVQLHHLNPIAESDGSDKATVWLCPNCHAMVHEIRKLYIAPTGRRVRYRKARLSHLDYWLDNVCSPELAKNLWDYASYGVHNAQS